MNPLAQICSRLGIKITGSDKAENQNLLDLRSQGATIWTPHSLAQLQEQRLPAVCAFSTAITPDNQEFKYLKDNNVTFWHRSDLLKVLADQFSKQIVISGTHGKTSTTAMLAWLLGKLNHNPSWVLGGILKSMGACGWSSSANQSRGDVFVFEGDESDQSFLKSNPYIGLVTSLEPDHLENYQNSFKVQIGKFQEFARKSQNFIVNSDCKNAQEHLVNLAKITYGIHNAHWKINPQNYTVSFQSSPSSTESVSSTQALNLEHSPGFHNAVNALGAVAAYFEYSQKEIRTQSIDEAIQALNEFPGIYRRFDLVGKTKEEITVIDDYAHHPTEIKAAIKAAREYLNRKNSSGRLIVAFQPHLPTRLRDLWTEFTLSFEEADLLFLSDLYIARGKAIEGIDCQHLAEQIKHPKLEFIPGPPENLVNPLISKANPEDLILILGAGDITNIRETLLEKLRLGLKI
jgi:UDP-N-acetylmuramate--alanine ligase